MGYYIYVANLSFPICARIFSQSYAATEMVFIHNLILHYTQLTYEPPSLRIKANAIMYVFLCYLNFNLIGYNFGHCLTLQH